MKKAILLSLGVGLLTAGLSVFFQTNVLAIENFPVPVAAAPTIAVLDNSFEVKDLSSRLRIPAIGVDARVQSVGLSWRGNGDIGVPTNFTDVAWYKKGPLPGMPGTAVINGHLDGKNVPEAVFYNLDKLNPSDVVEIEDQGGNILQFLVVKIKVYDYDDPTTEIFLSDTSKARLNLITCAGDWDKIKKLYNKRIVVFTELVTTID